MLLFALRAGFYLIENVFMGHAARAFSPSGRCSLWACGPRFSALRASCLRRGTFCSPKKFLKNGSLRWPCGAFASLPTTLTGPFETASKNTLHSQPSWGFPHLFSSSEGRGALCKTRSVSAAAFEANRLLSAGGSIMPLKCQLCLAFCQPAD